MAGKWPNPGNNEIYDMGDFSLDENVLVILCKPVCRVVVRTLLPSKIKGHRQLHQSHTFPELLSASGFSVTLCRRRDCDKLDCLECSHLEQVKRFARCSNLPTRMCGRADFCKPDCWQQSGLLTKLRSNKCRFPTNRSPKRPN